MTSVHTVPAPATRDAPPETFRLEALLVASGGGHESDEALVLARTIADRHEAAVQVVSACEPSLVDVARDPLSPPLPAGALADERDARLAEVQRQLVRALGRHGDWPVVVAGEPLDTAVATFATTSGAGLVVMGRGRHGAVDRLLNDEHVIRAVRTGAVPVLAVAEGCRALPKRAVIAIDFSDDSMRAARLALSLVADTATVYLVHVTNPPAMHLRHGVTWLDERDAALRAQLERVRGALPVPAAMIVECVLLNGYPPSAIVEFAQASHADLVAVGAHGRGFVQRAVIGRVASHVVRTARASVLCVPPAPPGGSHAHAAPRTLARSIPKAEWRRRFEEFAHAYRDTPVRSTSHRAGSRAPVVRTGPLLDIATEADGYVIDISMPGGARGERMHGIVAVTAYTGARATHETPDILDIEHATGRTRLDASL